MSTKKVKTVIIMTKYEKELYTEFKKEFGGELAEIIITLVILGDSVDNAIQSALELI